MNIQNLHTLRKACVKIQSTCHKNVNRVLELMVDHSGFPQNSSTCEQLSQYCKCCLVLEKLCDYIHNCCCNADEISDHCLNELDMKCDRMCKCCEGLMAVLEPNQHEYIRCEIMHRMCSHLCSPNNVPQVSQDPFRHIYFLQFDRA